MIAITENEFNKLSEYVRNKYGINLTHKKTLVVGRLQNLLHQQNFNSFSDYYNHIVTDVKGIASTMLINKLTTNHTFFMREPDHFEFFRKTALPYLVTREARKKDLRIWSAGCSSGEEPYTLAMIIADYFGTDKWMWDTKILATDISTKVLETAIDGIYPSEGIVALQENWRKNYFLRMDGEKSALVDKIKKEVIFKKLNLMDEVFPFKRKFHVIFCRNVMIYFDNKTKKKLVDKFYELTEPGGYLFIGHSESLNRDETNYQYVLPAVYRKS